MTSYWYYWKIIGNTRSPKTKLCNCLKKKITKWKKLPKLYKRICEANIKLQSFTIYLRQALVFKWNREEGWALSNSQMKLWYSPDISLDPKTLVVRPVVRELVFTSLLVIITLRFTCGDRNSCSTSKKSQSIMNMIIFKTVFYLLKKQSHFSCNLLYLSKRTS